MVKNSIYMVKMVMTEVEKLNKRLDKLDTQKIGLDEKEKIREQMIQRNKLIAEQRRMNQGNRDDINKKTQELTQDTLKRYVDRKNPEVK